MQRRERSSLWPEAQLNLAHAVVYLATAPKSNRVTTALGAARNDVQERRTGPVPVHLRDAHYPGARGLGHGEGYVYPHDLAEGWAEQQHRPDEVEGRRYYEPSRHGEEPEVAERISHPRRDLDEDPDEGRDEDGRR